MDLSSIIGLGLAGAGGMSLLYSLKSIPMLLYRRLRNKLIYTVTIYEHDELFKAFEGWFFANYASKYREVEAYLEDDTVAYKHEGMPVLIKYNNKRIIVSKNREKLEHSQDIRNLFARRFVLYGYLARNAIDALLKEVVALQESKKKPSGINIFGTDENGAWQWVSESSVKGLEHVVLPSNVRQELIGDVDSFLGREDWYAVRGIPYKRTYLLYGPPGNGKTTFALALASHLKRRVYVMSLQGLNGDTRLRNAFNNISRNSVLLLEDLDRAFEHREAKETTKVTFSGLLNVLDGAFYKRGLITIMTTNHLDKLDAALLRDGRTDKKILFDNPSKEQIEVYISRFYEEQITLSDLKFKGPMSALQELCIRNTKEETIKILQQ